MIRFLQELFKFIALLFTGIHKERPLEPMPVRYMLSKNYKYMCWCGKCVYHEERPGEAVLNPSDTNHETIHIYQAADCKIWIWFYIKYLFKWITGFSKSSYYTMDYEVEAYAKEYDISYLERREKNAVRKFRLKNRKQTWRDAGGTPQKFKEYIRVMFKDV